MANSSSPLPDLPLAAYPSPSLGSPVSLVIVPVAAPSRSLAAVLGEEAVATVPAAAPATPTASAWDAALASLLPPLPNPFAAT